MAARGQHPQVVTIAWMGVAGVAAARLQTG